MSANTDKNNHIGLLKSIGHESRTLLNGITGPIQIIRSLSDDSRLIEPLRILELSVSRIDNFSFRSLLLSDLLMGMESKTKKIFDFIDVFRYISLDLNDLNDFYNIKIKITNDLAPINIESNYELIHQYLLILLERIIFLSNEGSTINVDFTKPSTPECTITSDDNGLICKILTETLATREFASDIDLYLFKFLTEMLKIDVKLTALENQSITTLKLSINCI